MALVSRQLQLMHLVCVETCGNAAMAYRHIARLCRWMVVLVFAVVFDGVAQVCCSMVKLLLNVLDVIWLKRAINPIGPTDSRYCTLHEHYMSEVYIDSAETHIWSQHKTESHNCSVVIDIVTTQIWEVKVWGICTNYGIQLKLVPNTILAQVCCGGKSFSLKD